MANKVYCHVLWFKDSIGKVYPPKLFRTLIRARTRAGFLCDVDYGCKIIIEKISSETALYPPKDDYWELHGFQNDNASIMERENASDDKAGED